MASSIIPIKRVIMTRNVFVSNFPKNDAKNSTRKSIIRIA